MTAKTAAELYEKTWRTYTSLPRVGRESLSTYCKAHKVYYRGLRDWMRERSLVLSKSKQQEEGLGFPSIAPVTVLSSRSTGMTPSCALPVLMMKGIRITMPGGVHVSIREISGNDMSVLIDALKPH